MNQPTSTSPRIAFVQASWHEHIVGRARDGFFAELARHHVLPDAVQVYTVPGAFEIPLHAKRLAASGAFDAIVGCGFVVDGGIYRHEFVAQAVIDGLMRVMLDADVPVFSAVLTPQQFHDHEDHRRFFAAHMETKGAEVARACVKTLQSLRTVPRPA